MPVWPDVPILTDQGRLLVILHSLWVFNIYRVVTDFRPPGVNLVSATTLQWNGADLSPQVLRAVRGEQSRDRRIEPSYESLPVGRCPLGSNEIPKDY